MLRVEKNNRYCSGSSSGMMQIYCLYFFFCCSSSTTTADSHHHHLCSQIKIVGGKKKNTDTHIQTIAIFYFRVNLERHHTVFSMINLTCKIQIAWFNSEKLIVFHEKLQGEPWIITNLLTFWLAISLTPLIFFMQFIILRRSLFSKHSVIRIYFAFRAIDWYNTIN